MYRFRLTKCQRKSVIFSNLYILVYVVDAQKNRLIGAVPLSTHNICFGWEIRQVLLCYALLTKGKTIPLENQWCNCKVCAKSVLLCVSCRLCFQCLNHSAIHCTCTCKRRNKWFYMCKIFYGQGDPPCHLITEVDHSISPASQSYQLSLLPSNQITPAEGTPLFRVIRALLSMYLSRQDLRQILFCQNFYLLLPFHHLLISLNLAMAVNLFILFLYILHV